MHGLMREGRVKPVLYSTHTQVSRHIPENALVHQSTLDRINADIGYNPENLPDNYTVVPSK